MRAHFFLPIVFVLFSPLFLALFSAMSKPPPPSPIPSGSLVCTEEYVYGIIVHVIDGRSGTPITNAQVVIQEGTYQEALSPIGEPSQNGLYQGAGERPGTYRLTVSAPGYTPKTFENLVVSGGVCHVQTISREVSLLPY